MNQKEAYAHGYDRGIEAATYCEVAEGEDFESAAFDSEMNSRDFSPFEFFAHDVNETGDRSEGCWEAYDNGVAAGIRAAIRKARKASK